MNSEGIPQPPETPPIDNPEAAPVEGPANWSEVYASIDEFESPASNMFKAENINSDAVYKEARDQLLIIRDLIQQDDEILKSYDGDADNDDAMAEAVRTELNKRLDEFSINGKRVRLPDFAESGDGRTIYNTIVSGFNAAVRGKPLLPIV